MVGRHGGVSPVLGQPSGLRVPSGGCHPRIIAELRASTGTGLTLVTLHWAKRPLVFGPGPALAGSSIDPTVPSIPPALHSVSSSLPGSQLAQASCLTPLQRFPGAAGFSSAIAEQSALARRHSSRAVYQVLWSIYHG